MASLMSTNSIKPDQTATLSDFIAASVNDELTYRNFSIVQRMPCGIEVIDHCIISDYLDELRSVSTLINYITTGEILRYKYAPDLMAYDIYGYVQLDFVVMAVNGIGAYSDFTLDGNLYLPMKSTLSAFMSEIYNAETEYISLNRSNQGKYVM